MALVAACGNRTGLLVPEGEPPPGDDDSGSVADSGPELRDAGRIEDALPPLDVSVPHDAFNNCPDAGATLIYVVSEENELLSFYPPTAEFTPIGTLNCPARGGHPFSMAVDHTGIAYVLYSDGEVFRVSTATAACQATAFVSGQSGFSTIFGMGYSQNNTGTAETLYVVSGDDNATQPTLATINTQNFNLRIAGLLQPAIRSAELTGTGAGDLFAFYATNGTAPCDNSTPVCPDSAIGQIDKTTARVTNQSVLRGHPQGSAWAFGFWGGDFYAFTAPSSAPGTVVLRFNPSTGAVDTVAQRSDLIVGAGVSTCAPAQ